MYQKADRIDLMRKPQTCLSDLQIILYLSIYLFVGENMTMPFGIFHYIPSDILQLSSLYLL